MNKIERNVIFGIIFLIVVVIGSKILYSFFALRNFEYTTAIYKGSEGSAWGKKKVCIL